MDNFKSFITEQKEESYKIVCFYHTGDSSRDVMKDDHLSMMDTMNKAAKAKKEAAKFNLEQTFKKTDKELGKLKKTVQKTKNYFKD